MKTPMPGSGANPLIDYLNKHTAILTDQGIDVPAFIDRLKAFQRGQQTTKQPPRERKSRARGKRRSVNRETGEIRQKELTADNADERR